MKGSIWLLWLLASTVALAGGNYKLGGDVSQLQLTGMGGTHFHPLWPESDFVNHAVYELNVWTPAYGSCKVQMMSRNINNKHTRQDSWEVDAYGDDCGARADDKHTLRYSNEETYIRAVNVCSDNGGIAGVRIWGARLNRNNGELTRVDKKEWKLPGCTNWKTVRNCPDGKVVTLVTAVAGEAGSKFLVRGFKLQCQSLVPM